MDCRTFADPGPEGAPRQRAVALPQRIELGDGGVPRRRLALTPVIGVLVVNFRCRRQQGDNVPNLFVRVCGLSDFADVTDRGTERDEAKVLGVVEFQQCVLDALLLFCEQHVSEPSRIAILLVDTGPPIGLRDQISEHLLEGDVDRYRAGGRSHGRSSLSDASRLFSGS